MRHNVANVPEIHFVPLQLCGGTTPERRVIKV